MTADGTYAGMVSTTRRTKKLAAPIQRMVESFFAEQGLHARTLYRTDPARFGNSFGGNCPHNLLPKSAEANHITVYLEFNDANIHLGNVQRIIAFPDSVADKLPRHPKGRSDKEKVNLDALAHKYIFRDWDELKAHYRRIFMP